ncbi:hypothetical protein I4U23_015625 [Adineta vaga]|nr:hypothetical protein I4U23_015625 [Adineta vaga]
MSILSNNHINISTCLVKDNEHSKSSTIQQHNNEYYNDYFGISVKAPDGWHPRRQMDMLGKIEKETEPFKVHNHKSNEKRLQEALEEALPLFGFSEYSPDISLDAKMNPNIEVIAYNLKTLLGVTTSWDYLRKLEEISTFEKYDLTCNLFTSDFFGYIEQLCTFMCFKK